MFALATLATLALALRASAFTISTPSSLTLCQDVTFDIIGGNSGDQYTAYFVHGDDPCGNELFHLSNLSGDQFNWKVNVTAGTSVMVALDNGHDDEQWSGAVTVTGDDTSCLTGASASSSTSSTSSTQASVHAAATYTAPVNAASSAPSSTAASTSGASRAAFGISSALAVLGVAAVGLTL